MSRFLPSVLVANSLKASIDELCIGGAPFRSIDTRRLCAASYYAGRLVGYMEALEATDRRLARQVASELSEVLDSLDNVRRQFERRSR
jgi:hypothetical protein